MTTNPAPLTKAFIVASLLALGGCGSFGDFMTGSRSRPADVPAPSVADPPATEDRICELARQAVREAMNVTELRGATCTASHARPGEWQAEVNFVSGTERHAYRVALQPQRQRQGWAVVDITPQTTSS